MPEDEDVAEARRAIAQPRTRRGPITPSARAGPDRAASSILHLLVPGNQSVKRAHALTRDLELAVSDALPGAETVVHIEPIEDPEAWDDMPIDGIEEPGDRPVDLLEPAGVTN
ncbi:MAG: cation transporter dimerization domain-containing protein [Thermomicrobiales bacterium]